METVSSIEVDADGNAPNDLQVALILEDRLHKLSTGSASGDEVAKLWSVLEIAAQELEISVEKDPKSCRRRKKLMDSEGDGTKSVVCNHSCSLHMELPNPALWGSLPHEMLQLIFARLSLRDIRSLRCLSKDWKTIVTTDSDFHRICDAVHGSSFALISWDSHRLGAFWIRIFDVKFNTWDNFRMVVKRPALAWPVGSAAASARPPEMYTSVICGDGGLLCFVSSAYVEESKLKRTRPSLFITVVNPLTGISHELPPLLELCNIRMVQIIVSSEVKSFKVFVLSDYKTPAHAGADDDDADSKDDVERGGTAEVYDSTKRSWGRAEISLDLMFGRRSRLMGDYSSSQVFTKESCAYDFAEGRLLSLEGIGSPLEHVRHNRTYAHYKDRFFLLRLDVDGPANESLATQSPTYYIEEFCVQMPARTWVKVCNHRCAPFERPPKGKAHMTSLYACRGFLMVVIYNMDTYKCIESMRYGINLGWLYDLSSYKWRDLELPPLPLGRRAYNEQHSEYTVKSPEGQVSYYSYDSTCCVDMMCDLKWSA